MRPWYSRNLSVIGGAQNSAQNPDQTIIANKVSVAEYFTQKLEAFGDAYTSSADALAHKAIASVTADPSSVLGAEAIINVFV